VTRKERKHYGEVRRNFLAANSIDIVALLVFGKFQPATVVHHSNGRGGTNETNPDTFIATTKGGDDFIHEHPDLARELGFLTKTYYQIIPRKRRRHKKNNPLTIPQ
jgi:hypothetical protein